MARRQGRGSRDMSRNIEIKVRGLNNIGDVRKFSKNWIFLPTCNNEVLEAAIVITDIINIVTLVFLSCLVSFAITIATIFLLLLSHENKLNQGIVQRPGKLTKYIQIQNREDIPSKTSNCYHNRRLFRQD